MKAYVVIADQHDQFCVAGVSEHPVETPHVVLPVLHEKHKQRPVLVTALKGSRSVFKNHFQGLFFVTMFKASHGSVSLCINPTAQTVLIKCQESIT